tara:strand:+ start:1913 stop:2470 length:558 start_codon:yes stop_codon:yes gene_type:complete
MTARVGKLLVAHPNLPKDNWFYKTVIYIYSDNKEFGTLGIALNVKTNLSTKKLCYDRGILYPYGDHLVSKGGPINPKSCILLHTPEWQSQNTISVGPRYSLSSDDQMFERISIFDQPAYWRLFMGICGWGPGQLDMEIAGAFPYDKSNSWLLVNPSDDIVFNYDGDDQWVKAVDLCSQQTIDYFF